jgi:hypothetical protein
MATGHEDAMQRILGRIEAKLDTTLTEISGHSKRIRLLEQFKAKMLGVAAACAIFTSVLVTKLKELF